MAEDGEGMGELRHYLCRGYGYCCWGYRLILVRDTRCRGQLGAQGLETAERLDNGYGLNENRNWGDGILGMGWSIWRFGYQDMGFLETGTVYPGLIWFGSRYPCFTFISFCKAIFAMIWNGQEPMYDYLLYFL